jgi:quercetin dioxygenase-like cupin family protein
MRHINLKSSALIFSIVYCALGVTSCNNDNKKQSPTTEKSKAMVFPKGKKVSNDNFTGTVWLNYLAENDTTYNVNIGSVTFEPRARTNWHYHKGGQILLVTWGKGQYQEKGKPIKMIKEGDVVKCPPSIPHWHGATNSDSMSHIAIGTNTNIGGAVWLKPVTDEEFNNNSPKQ